MKEKLQELEYYFDYYFGYFMYTGDKWFTYMKNRYPQKFKTK